MAFMDSIETVCEACGGLRYSKEALQYTIDGGLNIAQVMDLSAAKASELFKGTRIEEKLRPMIEVGLPYLHLNQALSTLSGGEQQRLKIASHIGERGKIFIIDEPADGLHPKDTALLVDLFRRMVRQGNTVILIEHNMDIVRSADHVIELGPGAGRDGGTVLYAGTPEGMRSCPASVTAEYI